MDRIDGSAPSRHSSPIGFPLGRQIYPRSIDQFVARVLIPRSGPMSTHNDQVDKVGVALRGLNCHSNLPLAINRSPKQHYRPQKSYEDRVRWDFSIGPKQQQLSRSAPGLKLTQAEPIKEDKLGWERTRREIRKLEIVCASACLCAQ